MYQYALCIHHALMYVHVLCVHVCVCVCACVHACLCMHVSVCAHFLTPVKCMSSCSELRILSKCTFVCMYMWASVMCQANKFLSFACTCQSIHTNIRTYVYISFCVTFRFTYFIRTLSSTSDVYMWYTCSCARVKNHASSVSTCTICSARRNNYEPLFHEV